LRSAQGVISKSYSKCTKEEISEAYKEVFGLTPCGTCQGVDWKMIYNKVVKQYAKNNNILITMSNAKFIWNPKKDKVFTFVNGRVVKSDCKDQAILEKLFNDPKKDVVILNPNYKIEGKVETITGPESGSEIRTAVSVDLTPVDESSEIETVKSLIASGKTIDEIKEQTGLSKTKIKKYLNS
jgi:predicted metal-binding protein